jgi:hypothetical protein
MAFVLETTSPNRELTQVHSNHDVRNEDEKRRSRRENICECHVSGDPATLYRKTMLRDSGGSGRARAGGRMRHESSVATENEEEPIKRLPFRSDR